MRICLSSKTVCFCASHEWKSASEGFILKIKRLNNSFTMVFIFLDLFLNLGEEAI